MPTLQELADVLCEDDEIQYVTLKSEIASINKIEIGNSSSIFTKLKDYKYEFEIDSNLRLASINGIKIADQNNNEELKKLQAEFDNYKKAIAESLTKNGVETNKEDSLEIMTQNIDKIFMAGVHSKFIKVAENVSSRYAQNINVSNMDNYKNFDLSKFVIVNKQMAWASGTDREDIPVMTKSYNKETGILSLGKQKGVVNNQAWTFWNLYDVYVFDE